MCKGHLTFSKKGYLLMNRLSARVLLLIFPSLWGCPLWAQSPAPHVQAAKARSKSSAAKVAPIARQQLFGSIPISTRSEEARKFVEISLDRYENHIVDGAVLNARKAINRDPQFALGYAALSLASLGSIPDAAALGRAKALLPHTTPDERLLNHWITSTSDRELHPAITAMNDLLKRYPDNKHVLYIIADWLYFQQDYERSRQMLETVRHLDPDFPPALNLLGYSSALMGNYLRARAEYDDAIAVSSNPRDRSHCEFQKALVYFWEGQTAEGHAALDALNEKARRQKEPYSQFEIGFGRAMLAGDAALELEQLRSLELWLQSPSDGLSESDRDNFHAQVLRERARVSAFRGELPLAEASVRKLELLTDQSRDFLVANSYESARGYVLAAQGDFANAVDELAADPRSPLALDQLAAAQEKLGNTAAAEATRSRIKYLRAPTVEWYLLTTARTLEPTS